MQRLFSDEGIWPTPWMPRVLPNVMALVEHPPARTVFTRFIPPETMEQTHGRWRAYYAKWRDAVRDRLDPALLELLPSLHRFTPPAAIFDKPVYSALAGSKLNLHFRSNGVDTLIISGSETDVCVLSSALGAVDLGYRVIVAGDAVCSSSALIDVFKSRFDVQIEIAKVEEILGAWRPVALSGA